MPYGMLTQIVKADLTREWSEEVTEDTLVCCYPLIFSSLFSLPSSLSPFPLPSSLSILNPFPPSHLPSPHLLQPSGLKDCTTCMDVLDTLIHYTKMELEKQTANVKTLNAKLLLLTAKNKGSIDRGEELALLVKQNEELREALEDFEKEKINGKSP
jgi:hypothetical protein